MLLLYAVALFPTGRVAVMLVSLAAPLGIGGVRPVVLVEAFRVLQDFLVHIQDQLVIVFVSRSMYRKPPHFRFWGNRRSLQRNRSKIGATLVW